jgi:hypothetical protein
MLLWNKWMNLVNELNPSCNRKRTFCWLVIVLMGFSIKLDYLGVTSLARGVGLLPNYYTCLLNFFNSSAISMDSLLSLWVKLVFKHFDGIVKLNGRCLIIADGIKIAKEGKKMPGVKWLHQDSESNSKAEWIMGHSIQAIAILAKGVKNYFAVPLTARIHEGVRFNTKDNRTLLDKLFELLLELKLPTLLYLVADKYYCSGRLMKQLLGKNIHLITMMKKNAVAYYPLTETPAKKRRRGRPKQYGKKIKLFSLFNTGLEFTQGVMPNDAKIKIEYAVIKLLWRPLGKVVQFVLVKHPEKGNGIVMTSDLTLGPLDAILAYSLRFKIEVLFKQAVHQIGAFMYRFWLKVMTPRKRGSGDQELQFASRDFKEKIKNKLQAYHLFIQLGFIAQGLMQYLSIYQYRDVWNSFGSWLRTIRDNTLPSEKVVSMALGQTYTEFLMDEPDISIVKKFIFQRADISRLPGGTLGERLAA